MCGGTPTPPPNANNQAGLSPRVRGNPSLPSGTADGPGSIPACAGEPPQQPLAAGPAEVYPRVCGGTFVVTPGMTVRDGLSPRVRGNPHGGSMTTVLYRSIPACAGEPFGPPTSMVMEPVYPRVCGGTFFLPLLRPERRGLSPRVRGNQPWVANRPSAIGSIPACAGSKGQKAKPGPSQNPVPSQNLWTLPRPWGAGCCIRS